MQIDWHFIKQKIDVGQICTPFFSSKEQLIDIFTKGVTSSMFGSITSKFVLANIFEPAGEGVLEYCNLI